MTTDDVEMQVSNSTPDFLTKTLNKMQSDKDVNDPEDWVRVESNDGYSFLVKRKVANVSGTMRNALESSGSGMSLPKAIYP